MEGGEGQNVLRRIQNFLEWHPSRKDLYCFVHEHKMVFFHEKPKKKSDDMEDDVEDDVDDDVEDDVVTSCIGCSLPVEDHHPSYGCTKCQKFLHKACGELPVEIKHPAHLLHSLTLFQDLTLYVPLASSKGKFITCSGCEIPIQGRAYGCAVCRVFFHKTCLGFPEKMLHKTHPSHRLILDYEPHKTFSCRGCTQDHTGFNYSCDSCDFNLGVRCIVPSPPATTVAGSADEIQTGHLLVLLPEQPEDFQDDDCLECGKPIVDSQQQPIFRCNDCKFSLHHDCVLPQIVSMLPPDFKCSKHDHNLCLTTLREGYVWGILCDVCDQFDPEMGISMPSYTCNNNECDFDAHATCVLQQMDYSLAHRPVSVVLNISPVLVRKLPPTVGDIVKSMEEDEKKSLFNLVKAATSSTREKPKDHQQNVSLTNSLIDYPEYSHELFTQTMDNFKAKCLDSGLKFYAMKSQVTRIGSNLVPKALSPVFEVLNSKHSDTSVANSTPRSEGIRIFVFMVLCAAIYSICSTKESNLTEAQLYTCWECFKIVENAGFKADFAFKRLKKALYSYFGLQDTSSSDGSLSELDSDMANISTTNMEKNLGTCTRQVTPLSCYHPEIGNMIEIVGEFNIRDSWSNYPYSLKKMSSSDGNSEFSTDDKEHPDAIEEASIHREGEQRAKTTKVGADSNNDRHANISEKIEVFIEKRVPDLSEEDKKEVVMEKITAYIEECVLNNGSVLNLSEEEREKIMNDNFHNHKLSCPKSRTPKNNQISHTRREKKAICFACNLPISEPTYYCTRCKIYLHDFCVHLPRQIERHPLHVCRNRLVLDHKPGNPEKAKCNACGENCRGICYRCQTCNFNLEVQCIFRKPTEETKSHGKAVLMYDPTTPNSTQCFACRKKIRGPPFLRCAVCNVSLHKECELKSSLAISQEGKKNNE